MQTATQTQTVINLSTGWFKMFAVMLDGRCLGHGSTASEALRHASGHQARIEAERDA